MRNQNIRNGYNPDILETIANLSNDEVFTPPKLANKILDLLPKEIWSDSSIKFLDPACKTGIFLREITSRLIEGLAGEFPNLQERVNHILTNQVYGIGITELTTLMARRTLYCSAQANSEFSICTEFTDEIGNIVYPDTKHTWNAKSGRCEFCGANKDEYDRGENRENHAYSFIHNFNVKEIFGDMKFDVIIGNPPYQLSTNENGHQAIPMYHKFVEKAIVLSPKQIVMIIPSRWMKGGMGLSNFRKDMMSDKRIKEIHDFQNWLHIFPNVKIDGGLCYFLWDKNHDSELKYVYTDMNGESTESNRLLKTDFYDKIIRDNRQASIIKKALSKNEKTFDSIVKLNSFGIESYLFNQPERYPEIKFSKDSKKDYSLVYGVAGKGGSKRVSEYINNSGIPKGINGVDNYKLFFSRTYDTTATVPPKIIRGYPGSLATATFLKIGDFGTEGEMNNCLSYIETKFFRALLLYDRHSIHISESSFVLIPLQDFSKPWTDEELYKKYELTQEEISYIEENIAPMINSDASEELLVLETDEEIQEE